MHAETALFAAFERLVPPYPEDAPALPPRGFWPFVWACSRGLRRYIAAMTLFTAAIGVFEALLFAMLGRIVDWLGPMQPGRLWAEHGSTLLLLAAVLLGSTLLVAAQSMLKQQAMAGNFPMRLRWNFHRLLLQQSMSFYQDEFAGRIATKLMQTALAVRDVWMILADILVFVLIYFVTMVAVVGGFDAWLLLPFLIWVLLYLAALYWFVPRLARTAKAPGRCALADDRAHHRRLHQHRHRQAVLACRTRGRLCTLGDAGVPGHRACADAAGFRLRDDQPPARHHADPGHCRRHAVAVDAGPGGRGRGGRSHRHVAAAERHLALGHVGDGQPVRAGGHGAGRHQHLVAPAHGARPARRGAVAGEPRRAAVRRRLLPLRRQRRAAGGRAPHAAGACRRKDRAGRPLGCGQEHHRQPAVALP